MRGSEGRVLNHPSVVVDLAQVIAKVRCQVNQKILGGHGYFEHFFGIRHSYYFRANAIQYNLNSVAGLFYFSEQVNTGYSLSCEFIVTISRIALIT